MADSARTWSLDLLGHHDRRALSRERRPHLWVLVAFAVGAEIGGIVGAVLALPIAAMYPVVERLWLRPTELLT